MVWSVLIHHAIREYSFSRLEALCQQHKVEQRFREIIKHEDTAWLTSAMLWTLSLMAATLWTAQGVLTRWFSHSRSGVVAGTFFLLSVILVLMLLWLPARMFSESILCWSWPALRPLVMINESFTRLLQAVQQAWERWLCRHHPEETESETIDEDLRTVVDEGRREGVIEKSTGAIIERVVQFQHREVGAIMTPRTEMFCISADTSLEETRIQLLESGHSRVPVIGESTDDVLGILYAKDLLRALDPHQTPQTQPMTLRELIRQPLYVPEHTRIPALLELLRREHVHIAIVSDEYGGVAGLVTMEDVLEEIVGDIADEYDEATESQLIRTIDDHTWDVDATVHVAELNQQFGWELPEDEHYDTVGGLVFSRFGRMPLSGESIDIAGMRFTVISTDQRRMRRLRIERDSLQASTSTTET